MSGEAGGWMWVLIDVVAVVILAAALIYGIMIWRKRRSRGTDIARERATENLYQRPDPESREPGFNQRSK